MKSCEILLLLVKSCWIHEILWILWVSWNPIAFSKIVLDFMILCEILLDLMKYIMKSIMKFDGFHMNLCWIYENLWNPVGFNEIL